MTPDEAARLLGVTQADAPSRIAAAYDARDHHVQARLEASTNLLQQAKYREIRDQLAAARATLLGGPGPRAPGARGEPDPMRTNGPTAGASPTVDPHDSDRNPAAGAARTNARTSWTKNKTLNATVAALLVMSLLIRLGCSLFSSTRSADATAIRGATQLVAERLKAPSTASYPKRTVVAKDTMGHYLVHVVVDADNSFGATLRASFLVAVTITKGDGEHFQHNANGVAVQESSDPPTGDEIALMKKLNDW